MIGQSFSVEALAAVSAERRRISMERLRGLVRRELLQQEIDPRSPERGQYDFVQALSPRGRLQHARQARPQDSSPGCGALFRAAWIDELAGALAGHYLAAHANATEPGRPTRSPRRHASRSRPRPTEQRRLARLTRPSTSSNRRSRSLPTHATWPICTSGPAKNRSTPENSTSR